MAEISLKWHGDEVRARIEKEMHRRLDRSAITVANLAKQKISTAYPPASSPGEPPAKRTGRLRASVTWEPDGFTRRVGTNVFYGKILELGGGHIEPRPWLRPSLMESQASIDAILGAPMF